MASGGSGDVIPALTLSFLHHALFLHLKQLAEGQGLRLGGDYEEGQGDVPVCASFLPGEDLG